MTQIKRITNQIVKALMTNSEGERATRLDLRRGTGDLGYWDEARLRRRIEGVLGAHLARRVTR